MFPVSAESETGKPSASLLAFPLLMVTGMSVVFVLLLATFPTFIFQSLFGSHFPAVGDLNLLLSMNAAATGVYAIAVVLITYEMSRRIANTGWLQLVVSGLIVLGITWFHSTLLEVIIVQQVLRILLLLAVAFPFVKVWASAGGRLHEEATAVTEAEVIAEFLKNEFYQEEFQHDREQFEQLVLGADLADEAGNALRRALLFRRRGHMWRELPATRNGGKCRLSPRIWSGLRVFPRAQWRKMANGSFLLKDIVRRIKTKPFRGRTRDFIAKVQALSYHLRNHQDNSAVLLIGIDDEKPVTVLEGNHRLTAALLASIDVLQDRFRVYCGFSERMSESCWYQTNMPNLWRYGRNRVRNLFYDRDADVERLMRPERALAIREDESVLSPVGARKAITGSKRAI